MTPLIWRTERLAQFLQDVSTKGLWLVLGGTTAWSNDSLPPEPDPMWTTVPEAQVFKRVDKVVPVFPHSQGDLFTPDGSYQPVDVTDGPSLLQAKALQAFVSCRLRLSDTSLDRPTTFRIKALTLGLQRLPVHHNRRSLPPEQVIFPGVPVWMETGAPVTISERQGLDLHTILHF